MPTLASLKSWLRQTTTVQGLATVAFTVMGALAGGVPLWGVLGGAAASLVLMVMPGQGDFSGKLSAVVTDVGAVLASHGGSPALGILARDGLVLAGSLHPGTAVIPVALPMPAVPPASAA